MSDERYRGHGCALAVLLAVLVLATAAALVTALGWPW